MTYYRKVDVRMHSDEKYRRLSSPPPCGKFLWMYLLTHKRQHIPGLIEIGEAALAEELEWDIDGLRDAIAEAISEGMLEANWDARLIWIPNAIRYNTPGSLNVVKSWGPFWDELPECDLKVKAHEVLLKHLETKAKAFPTAFSKACRKPSLKASALPKPLPRAIHKHKHQHNHKLNTTAVDVDLKTCQVPDEEPPIAAATAAVVEVQELGPPQSERRPSTPPQRPVERVSDPPTSQVVALAQRHGAQVTAVLAMANDHLAIPDDPDELRVLDWRVVKHRNIEGRSRWLKTQLYGQDQYSPNRWPEVQVAWDAYRDADGKPGAKLGAYDGSCKAIVALYAAGHDQATVCAGIRAVIASEWWLRQQATGKRPGMGSISTEVFNRAMGANGDRAPTVELARRQVARRKEQQHAEFVAELDYTASLAERPKPKPPLVKPPGWEHIPDSFFEDEPTALSNVIPLTKAGGA